MGGGLNFLELILLIFILSFIFMAIYNVQVLGMDYILEGGQARDLLFMEENIIEAIKIGFEADYEEDIYGLDLRMVLEGILEEKRRLYDLSHRNMDYKLSIESKVLREGVYDVKLLIWQSKEAEGNGGIKFILREGIL